MPTIVKDIIYFVFNAIAFPAIALAFFVRVQNDFKIKKWLVFAIALPINILVTCLYLENYVPRIVTSIVFQIICFSVSLLLSRDKFWFKFSTLIVYEVITIIFDMLTYMVISNVSTSDYPYWIASVMCILAMTLSLYFSEQFIKSIKNKKFNKKSLSFLLIPVSQFITYYSIGIEFLVLFPRHDETLTNGKAFSGTASVILIASGLFALIADIIAFKQYIKSFDMVQIEAENKALEYQNQLNLNYFSELKENETELRKIKHDISGCLETMKEIIYTEKDTEKAQHFFDELSMTLGNITTGFYCKNSLINAIIISKSKICDKQGIRLSAEIKIPEALNISDTDFCRILVNMLDNAIEANEKEDKNKFIDLSIKENDGFIYLSTRNPFSGENIGSTTKENKKEHGYGLRILNDFAQKYDGYFKAESQSNTLSSLVVLKNEYSDN